MHPGDFEILDVARIDLVEAAVMVGLVGAVMRRPVVLRRLGVERRRVLGACRRDRQYGGQRQRGTAEISCLKSHRCPPLLSCLLDRVVIATFCSVLMLRLDLVTLDSGQARRHRPHGPTEWPS